MGESSGASSVEWEPWIVDWSPTCQALLHALVAHPGFDDARGTAGFYRTGTPDVRLGWVGSGTRRTILAVIRCEGDRLLFRLNIPLETALREGGGLFAPPPGDPHAAPNRADMRVTSATIAQAVEWLRRARVFTRP